MIKILMTSCVILITSIQCSLHDEGNINIDSWKHKVSEKLRLAIAGQKQNCEVFEGDFDSWLLQINNLSLEKDFKLIQKNFSEKKILVVYQFHVGYDDEIPVFPLIFNLEPEIEGYKLSNLKNKLTLVPLENSLVLYEELTSLESGCDYNLFVLTRINKKSYGIEIVINSDQI